MEKSIRKLLLSAMALVTVFALSACGEGSGDKDAESAGETTTEAKCEHVEKVIQGLDATCTAAGKTEGKECATCGEILVAQNEIPATGHTEAVLSAQAATCTTAGKTEGKECSVCGETLVEQTEIEALGHTTTTGTCDRCGLSFGSWELYYYVDEFQQPTNDGYVANGSYFVGTFSNSATTNSRLYVTVLADEEDIAFFLYEYGSYQVKNASSRYSDEYEITMKLSNGTKYEMTGTMYAGGDRLFVDSSYRSKVLNALKSGEEVSFYIVFADYTTSTYLFTVQTNNFAEEYSKL
ncbi:MAG: hypothetical protein IJV82_04215 [Oscillospiraceae bacterium]|nr:hypothetical protein [Oscillospiraceae bacterium]